MIYLSAQPDQIYFLWQLELQIFNFNSLGITKEQIHVLIGYDPNVGLHPYFNKFINENKLACIYIYADTRIQREYYSSLRPHIIAKHLAQFPNLENETFFYHDSDVLFIKKPYWEDLICNNTWYASDTRSYLDSNYIKSHINLLDFEKMCNIVGIDPIIVESENRNAGGAQYIIKKSTSNFWKKIEIDCEKLYIYLLNLQKNSKKNNKENNNKNINNMQIWCTDMWVLWWNILLYGKEFKTHVALNFHWANSPIDSSNSYDILHYTGNCGSKSTSFDKTKFQTHSPFYTDLKNIDNTTWGYFVVDSILAYRKKIDKQRIKLKDTTFVFVVKDYSIISIQKLKTICKCISRYFIVNILFITQNKVISLIELDLANNVDFQTSDELNLDNIESLEINSSNIWILPQEVILTVNQIIELDKKTRKQEYKVAEYKFSIAKIDPLGSYIFSKILDIKYIEENKNKSIPTSRLASVRIINFNSPKISSKNKKNEYVYEL